MNSSGIRFSPLTRTESSSRRTYIAGTLSILGALVAICVVLVSLWACNALDHDLFDVSRVDSLTRVILVTSQLLSVSALAVLLFLVQALASDQSLRRGSCHSLLLICRIIFLKQLVLQVRSSPRYTITWTPGTDWDRPSRPCGAGGAWATNIGSGS